MRIVIIIFISSILCNGHLQASTTDSVTAHLLLERIRTLQLKSNNYFPTGSFESYREYSMNKGQVKADFNAFFTGLICFTLRDIQPYLSSDDQIIAQQIIQNAAPAIELFKNKKGRDTYNFWSTNKRQIFPNSGWLNWLDRTHALPDDFDDTVISLLALNTDTATANKVHDLMQEYINGSHKLVNNTYSAYKKMPVYSTWFGIKMPVDFDISVLCNTLYFVNRYQMPYTKADSASLDLIVQVIRNKQHITDALYVSPYYGRLPIILYHLSRLMQAHKIPELELFKASLIVDAQKALKESDNLMDKIILTTALNRWGFNNSIIQFESNQTILSIIEEEHFSFFNANMPAFVPNPIKKMASDANLGMFYYYCAAYNQVLVLENLIWKKRQALTSLK
jgi:hypothetical protein